MIKALLLIFEPLAAWDRAARRSLGFTLAFYLLPMLLIVGAAEAYGLVHWGRWQSAIVGIKKFELNDAIVAETVQLILMVFIIFLGGFFVKAFGETFRARNSYRQALTTVIYGLSPVFLFRLLDMLPTISLWVPWVLGVMLMWKVLYHGVPRVMEPDPPHAFGLFFMSALLLTLITGVERYIARGYLMDKFKPFAEIIHQIAHKLHL